ncbi:MAG: dipeptidase [Gemmatimonadaceae bacterium]|nr:dipeptidase [Gemmatimonadaceae bacterium]
MRTIAMRRVMLLLGGAPRSRRLRRASLPPAAAAALALAALGCATAQTPAPLSEGDLVAKARGIHERVITLDTHVDINPANFRLDAPNYKDRLNTQVNLPKMREGGLDAAFLIVYVGQSPQFTPEAYDRAYAQAMEKFRAIHRLVDSIAPDQAALALTGSDVRRASAQGKKAILIGVENGYPIGTDVTRVKQFYDLGARYLSMAHNGHSQLSDSNTGERDGKWQWNGVSPLGEQVIAEANRVGIMLDISHPSKQSMMRTLALSKAPIIASHSGVRALADHSRNLDDEQLKALAKNGGVAQLVAFDGYVKIRPPDSPERVKAIQALRAEFGLAGGGPGGAGGVGPGAMQQLPADKRSEFQRRLAELNQKYPAPPKATVKDFVNHVDYAVKLIGIDHVGISSDFDGGGGVDGWNDATETFNVTLELVRRGYTEEQIGKLWSGNLLRVLDEVQRVAAGLQRTAGRTTS